MSDPWSKLSAPVQVQQYSPDDEDKDLSGMFTPNEATPGVAISSTQSLGQKAVQSFGASENAVGKDGSGYSKSDHNSTYSPTAATGNGTYDPEAMDKVQSTLSGVSNVAGILSNFAPGLAPVAGMAGLASTGISGIRTVNNIATGKGSLLDNVAGALTLGSSFVPGLAVPAMIAQAGNAAYKSYSNGILGDAMDSRSYEATRDALEARGYSRVDSGSIAKDIAAWESQGVKAPSGLSTRTIGSKAAGMFGGSDRSDNNVGGERGSSTGTGGGYNDGRGGVTGL